MNNFIFYSPTEFVFGKETELQTGALVKKFRPGKEIAGRSGHCLH